MKFAISPSKTLMRLMRHFEFLPKISDTERQALEAGDVWIDGQVFSGKPRIANILSQPYGKLSAEEQSFLDVECEELCAMIDPWKVYTTRRIPDDAMEYVKSRGFMGLMIPVEWGGKGFSRLAISTIMAKLMPRCSQVATLVIIANSLSAAELLIHYGTHEQKSHYLPRLAKGEYIPCFALTELTAGSDAESIQATAVVFRDTDGELKLRMDFEKRYMTLGSIANLATVACKVFDPEELLSKGKEVGITTVLVHKGTPGFHSGDHHLPIGAGFENGPVIGKDVIVSVDNIIGGRDCAGQGWRMLMEQLAGGRGISLPAGAIGCMMTAMTATAAYGDVRSQFGMPIRKMQGVEERIGRMAALTYMFEAFRVFLCSAIDSGVKPPVTSGMFKAYSTEWSTRAAADGMNVLAGAGVMKGPNNILALLYESGPVGLTVEGANIMTFTFLINGQGAVRCHPYSLKLVHAIENDDPAAFRSALLGWIAHAVTGSFRNFVHSLTSGATVRVPKNVAPETRGYYKRLGWAAARLGVLTDMALLLIGAALKKEGRLNSRYADAFAWIMMSYGALRRFEAEGRKPEDLPLVRASIEHALGEVQKAYEGIYANFKFPVVGWLMRKFGLKSLRNNPLSLGTSDRQSHEAALTVAKLNDQFKRLSAGVFIPAEDQPALGRLMKAFRLRTESSELLNRITAAQKTEVLPKGHLSAKIIDQAVSTSVVNAAEAEQLKVVNEACLEACKVDVFTSQAYYADAK